MDKGEITNICDFLEVTWKISKIVLAVKDNLVVFCFFSFSVFNLGYDLEKEKSKELSKEIWTFNKVRILDASENILVYLFNQIDDMFSNKHKTK